MTYPNPISFRPFWMTFGLLAVASCGSEQSSTEAESNTHASLEKLQLSTSGNAGAIAFKGDTNFCVDIQANSAVSGANVQIYHCNGTTAQSFSLTDGMLQASNNRCLNVRDGKRNNGATVQMWACSASDQNSQFSVSNGQIKWKTNGKCLDLRDGKKKDGQPLQMWECGSGNQFQQWALATSTSSTATQAAGGASTTAFSTNSPVKDLKRIAWSKFTPLKMSRGQVNNEQEAYVTDGSTISVNSDNQLVIKAYVAADNNGATGRSTKWVSGRLNSPNLGISRGYIEARIKTPSASGTWPAFWLMPNNNSPTWPQGGEIDIMEQVNGLDQQNVSTHWGPSPSQTHDTHQLMNLSNFSNTWHTFGLAFDSTHCSFYFVGKKAQTVKYAAGSPFAAQIPQYGAILNLAMGGSWPNAAEASIGAQTMTTDYVAISSSVPSDF